MFVLSNDGGHKQTKKETRSRQPYKVQSEQLSEIAKANQHRKRHDCSAKRESPTIVVSVCVGVNDVLIGGFIYLNL